MFIYQILSYRSNMWSASRLAQIWLRIPRPFQQRQLSTMAATEGHRVHTTERLARLRALMKKDEVNVQAFVVPSEDQRIALHPHSVEVIDLFCLDSSEYPASCDKRRAFISGFNGSAGVLLGPLLFL